MNKTFIILFSCLFFSCSSLKQKVNFVGLQKQVSNSNLNKKSSIASSVGKMKDYKRNYCTPGDSVSILNNNGARSALFKNFNRASKDFQEALSNNDQIEISYNYTQSLFGNNNFEAANQLIQTIEPKDNFTHFDYNKNVIAWYAKDTASMKSLPIPPFRQNAVRLINSFSPMTVDEQIMGLNGMYVKNALVKQRLGYLHFRSENINKAARNFKRGKKSKDSRIRNANTINTAMCYYHKGQYKKADNTLSKTSGRINLAEKYFAKGIILEKRKGVGNATTRARTYYNTALKYDKNFYKAYIALGNINLYEDDFISARAEFDKALSISPKEPTALLGKAICLYETTKKKIDMATVHQLEQVLHLLKAIDDDIYKEICYKKYLLMGYTMLKRSAYSDNDNLKKEAELLQILAVFDQAISFNENDVAARVGKGIVYINLEKPEQSISVLSEAIAIEGDNPHLFLIRANIEYRMFNYENAKEDYLKASTLDTLSLEALNGVGICERGLNNYQSSIQYLDKASRLSKGSQHHDLYLNNLALSTFYLAGTFKEQFVSDQDTIAAERAKYYYESAITLVDSCQNYNPDYPAYIFNKGTFVYDSIMYNVPQDSFAIQLYYQSGVNEEYVLNNIGVLSALDHNFATAKKSFKESKTISKTRKSKYYNYTHYDHNLKVVGEKIGLADNLALKKDKRRTYIIKPNQNEYVFTLLYHHSYLYKYDLFDKLQSYNEPIIIDAKPEINYEYHLLMCNNEIKQLKKTKPKRIKTRSKNTKYKGSCPSFGK